MHLFKLLLSTIIFTYASGYSFADSESKFKVGVIAPLSGALAEYGVASKNGIELAIKEHPELFKDLNFIYEDSQWDAKTAISSFVKLTTIDKVNLVYNWGNPTTEALAPIVERSSIPMLALSLDERVSIDKNFIIRTINRSEDFSIALARYINNAQYKKIGIVVSDNTYVRGLFNGLKAHLDNDITIEEVESYPISEQDFRSSIVKIRAKKYDLLGVFLISGQISNFYKQMAQQGVKIPSVGTDFFESSTEIEHSQGGMEGAIYPHLGVDPEFYKRYVDLYSNDYQIAYAGNAYDMAMIFGSLFSEQLGNKISPEEIMQKLKSVKGIEGIGGEFSFKEDEREGAHYHYPVRLKKIVGGKIKEIN